MYLSVEHFQCTHRSVVCRLYSRRLPHGVSRHFGVAFGPCPPCLTTDLLWGVRAGAGETAWGTSRVTSPCEGRPWVTYMHHAIRDDLI